MPYQRSTQASGFRARKGPDESKQLRQYADALDKQRKENVTGMERQGVQMTNEMTRIDALASKKDTYELQNLRNFSKTLDTFMNTMATNVVKPVFDQQIENGVAKGIKYQQGDPDVVAEIDANDAQLKEIEDRIALQAAKTAQTEQAIRDQWEKEGKIASLKEEYRLLNIKKLGSNRAFGFRKGILLQSKAGWDAYRDSSLLYNEENERSTEDIGSEEDPIIVGHYHRYIGEDGFEKRKAILGHLTNKYVVEKGKESGLSESFINKLLTRPILQSNAEFQHKEAKKALLEEAAASSEYNKYQISQGIVGIDSNHEQLELGAQNWILTEPGNLKALNTAGGNTVNAVDGLLEAMVGEASEIRTDAMKNEDDQLDFIDAIENKIKVYVPGLSKRVKNADGEWVYEKKFLHELWPNKFNIDNIEALLAEETGKFQREKYATLTSLINGDKNRILKDFALTRDTQAFDTAIGVMENNSEYLGHPGIDGLKKKMEKAKEKIRYPRDLSDKKLNDLFEENGKAIRDTHPTLKKLDEGTIKQGILDGKIDAELFHKADVEKAAHLKNVDALKDELLKALDLHAGEIEWDKDDSQVVKAINLLDATLYNYTKKYLSDEGATIATAVVAANQQLTQEVMSHISTDIPNVDGKTTWEIDAKGFTNTALNDVAAAMAQPWRDINTEVIKDDATIKKFKQRVDPSGYIDVFSDPSQPPVVNVEDFEFNSAGKVKQIWNKLAILDPLGRTAEMLYDLEADKLPMIQKGNWPQDVKDEIAEWESLYPNVRRALIDGDFQAGKRAMQEIGKLDIDSTIGALLGKNGNFLALKEDEVDPLLTSLGLPPMTKEELEANPEVLLAAYKKKIITVTEQVQTVTTDQNQAIRMIFAGLKFGDITKWNDGDFGKYTMGALNSYYSGDRRPLDKLEGKLNLDVNGDGSTLDLESGELIQVYDDPGNDINAIEEQLAFLDANEPPRLLKTGTVPASLGLIAQTEVNRHYTVWAKQKQLLNDRQTLMGLSQERVINPNQESTFFASGKRLIGDTRYTELQNAVIEKYPKLEIHPKYGTLYDPSGKGRYTKTFDEGKEMMKVLMLNELDFEGAYAGGVQGDTTGDLTYPKELYTTGSEIAGKLPKEDLVTVRGMVFGNSSANRKTEDIKIRKDVAPDLNSMMKAASDKGIYINFAEDDPRLEKTGEGLGTRLKWNPGAGSGFRKKKDSERLFNELGEEIAAKPGFSTHNLGAGIDIQFSDDNAIAQKQLEWMHNEGWKYGFVPYSLEGKGDPDYSLTLNDNEVWHFDWRPEYKNSGTN